MYMAGQGHVERSIYDLIIPGAPGPTRERLEQMTRLLTTKKASWFHHSHYVVTEAGGSLAASLCSFNARQGGGKKLVAAFTKIGWSGADLHAMVDRMQPVFRVQPSLPRDAWIIENVATTLGFRGRGIIGALLEHAVEKGRDRGYGHFQIACMIGNTPAQRAYEKIGFRVVEELRDSEFERIFGTPGMSRLTMQL
jgi:GNAT superfamily N-acetyltransferase